MILVANQECRLIGFSVLTVINKNELTSKRALVFYKDKVKLCFWSFSTSHTNKDRKFRDSWEFIFFNKLKFLPNTYFILHQSICLDNQNNIILILNCAFNIFRNYFTSTFIKISPHKTKILTIEENSEQVSRQFKLNSIPWRIFLLEWLFALWELVEHLINFVCVCVYTTHYFLSCYPERNLMQLVNMLNVFYQSIKYTKGTNH